MKRAVYEQLVGALRLPCSAYPDWDVLTKQFGVSLDTLVSIYSQENQRRILRCHHLHKNDKAVAEYARRYEAGESILQISSSVDLPPISLARLLLEAMLGLSKQAVGAAIKDPLSLVDAAAARPQVDASLLVRLQKDVELCVAHDHISSPFIDTLRRIAGQEYEAVLEEKLSAAGVPFLSEEELRANGFAKTPDVKLEVPIAVRGRVVNWIDSKACFCDEYTHRIQADEQFKGYINRYGPGMVIYWFGYIEELDTDRDVVLMDDFPPEHEIVRLGRA